VNTQSKEKTPSDLFADWQTEDQGLESFVSELRDWMNGVNQLGIPQFGEAGDRLRSLRRRLLQHFDREDEIIEGLSDHFDDSSSTVSALRTRYAADHRHIQQRLDDLMERLGELEPPFESWIGAMDEIESFVNGLEQHEREELDNISALLIVGESQI